MATKYLDACCEAVFATNPTTLGATTYPTFNNGSLVGTGGAAWSVESSILAPDTIRTLKFTNGTPANGATALTPTGSCASSAGRISLYQQLEVIGATKSHIFGTAHGFSISVYALSDGSIALATNSGSTTLATSASSGLVAANTWHRYCLAWTITSATVYSANLYLDGVQIVSVTNGAALIVSGTSSFQIGCGAGHGDGKSVWFAHLYCDDSSSLTDTGDIRVTAKLPAAVNNNAFANPVGSGAVNERPISETNGASETGTTAHSQDYTLEAAAVGDVNISRATIVAYCGWVWAKAGSGTAGTPKLTFNGVSTATTLATSSRVYVSAVTDSASYPSNAAGIGMVSSGAGADTFFYEGGAIVAYTPLPVPSSRLIRQAVNRSAVI